MGGLGPGPTRSMVLVLAWSRFPDVAQLALEQTMRARGHTGASWAGTKGWGLGGGSSLRVEFWNMTESPAGPMVRAKELAPGPKEGWAAAVTFRGCLRLYRRTKTQG